MPKHTKIDATTKKYSTGKRTTSKDIPGTGMAKKTATAVEKRRKYLESI